jgi:hypothetical protein
VRATKKRTVAKRGTPALDKARELLFARQVREELDEAKQRVQDAESSAGHYADWLTRTGKDEVWGDDARSSKRDLAKEKKNLAFWHQAARELKALGMKP